MPFTRYLLAAGAACLLTGTAGAQVFEGGDAGQTPGSAQNAAIGTPGSPITTINGTIGTHNDADLYKIYISSPSTFSASVTTISKLFGRGQLDTALFLFSSSGAALGGNDDADESTRESILPAGDAAYSSRNPGFYYLGISLFENEPVNSKREPIFVEEIDSNRFSVRGPASGLQLASLFNFDNNAYGGDDDTGSYIISLTGASAAPGAVPEPATWAMMIAGFAAAGMALRRRRPVAALA